MSASEPLIKIEDLSYLYEDSAPDAHPAIKKLSLEIQKGEFVAILGHNGSGKSTLIKRILQKNGLEQEGFSKKAIDLTLPEAAMIVGITQAPTRFDPFKNPENCTNKRNTVLMKMYELEKIRKEE